MTSSNTTQPACSSQRHHPGESTPYTDCGQISPRRMVRRDDHGGSIESLPNRDRAQKRQRTEDVKMCFNAAAGYMNQNRRRAHLCDRDGMPRHQPAGMPDREHDGQTIDDSTEKNRCPHMRVHLTRGCGPRPRGKPDGCNHAGYPLKCQKRSEHAIRTHVELPLMLAIQFSRARLQGWICRVGKNRN